MARKRTEAGQSFLEGLWEKIPEDKRDTAQAILTPLADEFGDALLRQDEFSRRMNEIQAKQEENDAYKARLDDWYTSTLAEFEEKKALLQSSSTTTDNPATTTPSFDTRDLVRKSDVEKMVQAARNAAAQELINHTSALTGLNNQYQIDFKSPPPPDFVAKLYNLAAQKQIPYAAAYSELTSDLRTAGEQKRREEERKALEAEIRGKILEEQRKSPLPYSVPSTEPTTLAGLGGAKGGAPEWGVQAALNEYYRTQQP